MLKINGRCRHFLLQDSRIKMKKSALFIVECAAKPHQLGQLLARKYSATNLNTKYLTGVFPSISTPFERLKNEPVSWHNLEKNLKSLLKTPFSGEPSCYVTVSGQRWINLKSFLVSCRFRCSRFLWRIPVFDVRGALPDRQSRAQHRR